MTTQATLDRSIRVGILPLALLAAPADGTADPRQVRFQAKGAFLTPEFPRDGRQSTHPSCYGIRVLRKPGIDMRRISR